MFQIIQQLQNNLKELSTHEIMEFEVLNPDLLLSTYNGALCTFDTQEYIYRGYKTWIDLAHQLQCKMLTPKESPPHKVLLRFQKLNKDVSFHNAPTQKEEKYGIKSLFNEIHKNEESGFIHYYTQALEEVSLDKRVRILNLGINSGDEFEALLQVANNHTNLNPYNLELVGIDFCASAIDAAQQKFHTYPNISFYTHDITQLSTLALGKFDLIISIGTLQSSNLEYKPLLMDLVQNHLTPQGAMILAFPNCRWVDGEMLYGARVKNYPFSEMGLLYSDVIFAKKYLQQKKFRVRVTGKDYIFVTASSIRK
jgi:cyclopropane fatty-acyl-phospholipid synthase-like methyltransferase